MPIAEQQLRYITTDIWSVMFDVALTPRTEPVAHMPGDRAVTGCVQITGEWEGAVMVYMPAALARRACAKLLAVDEQDCTAEDMQDTVGELVNITGGNVKGLLARASQLSLPSVTVGSDYRMTMPQGRIIAQATFDCDAHPLQVTVHERTNNVDHPLRPLQGAKGSDQGDDEGDDETTPP